jgi:hypothetical protein
MNPTTCGLDVAKRIFQMYWVDAQTGAILNRRESGADQQKVHFPRCTKTFSTRSHQRESREAVRRHGSV